MESALKALTVEGAEPAGFAAVFFYSHKSNVNQFLTVCQSELQGLPENFADFGHKELRRHLMQKYGRVPNDSKN